MDTYDVMEDNEHAHEQIQNSISIIDDGKAFYEDLNLPLNLDNLESIFE